MTPGSSSKLQATSLKLQALKLQAASLKPQATSLKLQAASDKLPDSRSLIKFWLLVSGIKNQDKSILWMSHVKRYLVW